MSGRLLGPGPNVRWDMRRQCWALDLAADMRSPASTGGLRWWRRLLRRR